MSATLHFELTADTLISANHRLHWAKKAERTRHLRTLGQLAARGQNVGADTATLLIEIGWPNKRRRDAENLAPTIKALIDGAVVDGGLLSDDSDTQITERTWRTYVAGKTGLTVIDLTLTAKDAA
jgi:crossover junction endodeoxyribonuclease RusA